MHLRSIEQSGATSTESMVLSSEVKGKVETLYYMYQMNCKANLEIPCDPGPSMERAPNERHADILPRLVVCNYRT